MSSAKSIQAERARKAVSAFRAMQPSLSGFAQALTGKPNLQVRIAEQGGFTDGKNIFYKPPIALGDMTPHSRSLCDIRDPETGLQQCEACAVREEVMVNIYHEIAHNIFGSFETPSESQKSQAMKLAVEALGSKRAERVKKQLEASAQDHFNLSRNISPFLPTILNSVEDVRVEARMFEARRGTKVMFEASNLAMFRDGIEDADGSFHSWSERPLNSQAMIGVFVLGCGYSYQGWFHETVEKALGDKTLQEYCSTIVKLQGINDTYALSLKILFRLRELGFCLDPNDPNDSEESDEQENEEGDSSSGEGSEGESSSSSDSSGDEGADGGDASPDQETSGEGSSDSGSASGGSGEGAEQDSDASLDEADNGGRTDGDEPSSEGGEGTESEAEGPDSSDSDSGEEGDGSEEGDLNDGEDRSSGGEDQEGSSGGSDNSSKSSEESGDRGEESDSSDSPELVDTGADEGKGGEAAPPPRYGTADEAQKDLEVFSKHDFNGKPTDIKQDSSSDESAMQVAIVQGLYFETESINVTSVREFRYGVDHPSGAEAEAWASKWSHYQGSGTEADLDIPESILGPALLEMRRVFSDNERASMERHLRSGRINQKVLGKRAWAKDDRLFQKKRLPGKKSYAVILGIDISASTFGLNIALAKRAAMAQAELLSRAGIDFAVYAHSAEVVRNAYPNYYGLSLDIYELKSFDDPWGPRENEALEKLGSASENIDGHTIEYYRKAIERHPATDKIILYYSDGKMPAANHDEELEILTREIATCKKKNITLMGVGIRTDSPSRHGLETVQVDDDSDLVKVIRHLKNGLLHNR